MTVTETTTPSHFVQAFAAALASAGVAAMTSVRLFSFIPLSLDESPWSVLGHLPAFYVLAMTATVAAVIATPALQRAGGWLVPLAGLTVIVACIWVFDTRLVLMETGQIPLIVGYGMALGGVLAAAAIGGSQQRVAIAIGVAFGLATGMASMRLLIPEFLPGQSFALSATVQVAVIAAPVVVAAAWASRLHTPDPLAQRPQRRELLMPTILAAVLYLVVLAGNQLRLSIVENLQAGLTTTSQAIESVSASDYFAIGLGLLVGLILVWYGYRAANAQVARWLLVCVALAGMAPASVYVFQFIRTENQVGIVLVPAAAAVAGGLLARYVGRDLPWEVAGIAMAAFGMIYVSIGNPVIPSIGDVVTLLIGAGVAFALSSALVALLGSVAHPATALSLGLVTLILAAYAMRSATALALQSTTSDDLRLSISVTSLLAAAGILALLHFSRASDRARKQARDPHTSS